MFNCFHLRLLGSKKTSLVGGFNPFEKYSSNWIISPGRGQNEKYLKPQPRTFSDNKQNTMSQSLFLQPRSLLPKELLKLARFSMIGAAS